MYQDLNCRFFIYSDKEVEGLLLCLEELTSMTFDEEMTAKEFPLYLELKYNLFYDKKKSLNFPDGFISYPYILEIECDDIEERPDYLHYLSNLLLAMWNSGLKVVASSDFEEELPYQGGYGSWVNQIGEEAVGTLTWSGESCQQGVLG